MAGRSNLDNCSNGKTCCTKLNMKGIINRKNSMNLKDYRVGTCFGKMESVRIKLTHKDLIIVAGIVVAVIIALTTLILDSGLTQAEVKSNLPALIKSTPSPTVLIQKLGQSFFSR
jgi:hypothetical protein